MESIEKLCILDEGENHCKTTIQTAIIIIKVIKKAHPEIDYYVGYTSINAKDFLQKCPQDRDVEEFVAENMIQQEHGLSMYRKVDSQVDTKKRFYDLHQFITVDRAESSEELRWAEKEILDPFLGHPGCKNEKRGGGRGMSNPFQHGYVYFASNGLPLNRQWLQRCLRRTFVALKNRCKSVDSSRNQKLDHEFQKEFGNMRLADENVQNTKSLRERQDKATQTEKTDHQQLLPRAKSETRKATEKCSQTLKYVAS